MLIKIQRQISLLLVVLVILSVVLTGCAPDKSEGPVKLRIAALRILDTLPLYVAEQQGYFAANSVEVEFIPVSSAPERDQLIAAGQADGMINEAMSTLFSNRNQVTVQIVRIARAATKEYPVFRLLANRESGVTDLETLKTVETGISQGTIIEYLMDRLVEAEGYNRDEFPKINVPSIPDRLTLMNDGELKASILPDPFSLLALQGGAVVVIDDSSHPEYGYSTIAFRKETIDNNPEAIRGFLKAVEQAVADVNTDPGKWIDLLVERELLPAPLVGTYQVGPYPTASVPSEAQIQDAIDWARSKNLLDSDLAYSDTVNDSFLP